MTREIRVIRSSFRKLVVAFTRIAPYLTAVTNQDGNSDGKLARRRPRLTAAQRAALKLQGRYMGTMRGLKPAQAARVKRIRAEKGIRAATGEARRMAG